ncbi:MAG: radical SAM protein [Promethearchaeota archaeon]
MIYGPFLSRRLGYSLGIDLLPPIKTCTFNCTYCEIGKTYKMGFVSISHKENVLQSEFKLLERYLTQHLPEMPFLDSITLGYNGEPTLVQNLKEIIIFIRKIQSSINNKTDISIFTNSSTICDKNIRNSLILVDNIHAKLDAADPKAFQEINRPHPSVPPIEQIINALAIFQTEINAKNHNIANSKKKKKLIIQTLLFKSSKKKSKNSNNLAPNTIATDTYYTDNIYEENIAKLAEAYAKIMPYKIHLYTVARTPAENYILPLDLNKLQNIKNKMISLIPELENMIEIFD